MSAKLIRTSPIQNRIVLLRGQKVMLDFDLAELYGVSTKVLNQAVKRNIERFPDDFLFQLTRNEAKELARLRSQNVTLNDGIPLLSSKSGKSLRSQFVTLKRGRHRKFSPYAFTEQGVAMLSSVLRSARAVRVNIEIMRAFVQLRQWLASNAELARRLKELEKRYDRQFRVVFDAIRQLMDEDQAAKYPEHREIGFHTLRESSRSRRTAPSNHYS